MSLLYFSFWFYGTINETERNALSAKIETLKISVWVGLLVLISINQVTAQASAGDLSDALGFNETVDDVPEAPIHFLVGFFLAIGTWVGIRKLK